jgi:putative hydrolase of the HAD superfamily
LSVSRGRGDTEIVPRRYDWIFLDAGETLLQVVAPGSGFGEVLAEVGYPLPADQLSSILDEARSGLGLADHVGGPPAYPVSRQRAEARRRRLVEALLRGIGVRAADRARCRGAIWQAFADRRFFALFPEVTAVLERLTGHGYRLGVISNWEPRLELLCHSHGLGGYFEFVLASEAEGFAKPGPHLFRRALQLSGAEPRRAIHVGDSYEQDVLGASAVGLQVILLDRGGYYSADTWQPTIRSLTELLELV